MEYEVRPLNRVPEGKTVKVHRLLVQGAMRHRLQDIGVTEGSRIQCLQKSAWGDPVSYLIRGAVIALRCEESSGILVEPV